MARGNIWTQSIIAIAYEKAWQAFIADPTVMARTLVRNATDYAVDLPSLLFRQYANVASIPSGWIALGIAGPILVVGARIKTPFYARTLGFFILVFLTTAASAAVIYADDGRRVMVISNVLLSLGLALGFAIPGAPRPGGPAAPSLLGLYLVPVVVLLVFGLPALVKARIIHRTSSFDYAGDAQRIAAPPVTAAVLVQPNENPLDRRQTVVPSELLRQIGHSVSFDPEFSHALDYAATNAPGTLLEPGFPFGGIRKQILLGGQELLEHRESDLRVKLAPINGLLFRIVRWWPESGRGGGS